MERSSRMSCNRGGMADEFLSMASSWYFGGYLKMDKNEIPNPTHLIIFLRAMGLRLSELEMPVTSSSPKKMGELQIDINCNNPRIHAVMKFPGSKKEVNGSSGPDGKSRSAIFPQVPGDKSQIAKEVFQLLMEFLLDVDEMNPRKRNLDYPWRKCMSMDTLGHNCQRYRLPAKPPVESDKVRVRESLLEENESTTQLNGVAAPPLVKLGTSDKVTVPHQELAMHVEHAVEDMDVDPKEPDSPVSSNSSLRTTNLSPIGLVRQRTWVLSASKGDASKEFEKAGTSTPTRAQGGTKSGILATRGSGKILRPRLNRPEIQPGRLKSVNTEVIHSITQAARSSREISTKSSNSSRDLKNTSTASSVSSQSSVDSARRLSNLRVPTIRVTSSRLPQGALGGAKPKFKPTASGQLSSSSGSNASLKLSVNRGRSPMMTISNDKTKSNMLLKPQVQGPATLQLSSSSSSNASLKGSLNHSRSPAVTNTKDKTTLNALQRPQSESGELQRSNGSKIAAVRPRPSLLPRLNSTKSTNVLQRNKGSQGTGKK